MKKKLYILILLTITMLLTGCTKKYEGYWCTYDETATIVVLLNDDYKEKEKQAIEDAVKEYENVENCGTRRRSEGV